MQGRLIGSGLPGNVGTDHQHGTVRIRMDSHLIQRTGSRLDQFDPAI